MQLLIDKEWKKYYSCFCQGSLKEYWNNKKYPQHEIRIRPTRNTFTMFQKNMLIDGPKYLYKLEETLTKHGIAN